MKSFRKFRSGKYLGLVLLPVLVFGLVSVLYSQTVFAATLTVDSIGDAPDDNPGDGVCETATPGECTLRAAIQEANALAGADTINFSITGAGVHTLTPASCYDDITESVTIDGYSQPGSAVNTAVAPEALNWALTIEIDGTNVGGGCSGLLSINASDSVLKGLHIHSFHANGVYSNGTSSSIVGNYITNNSTGIELSALADNSLVGGVAAADRNVVSGNSGGGGINIISGNSGSVIRGNYIGVAADGTTNQGNVQGIDVGGINTVIGGTDSGSINVVSGNNNLGIRVRGSGVGSVVQGNYIGLDRTGLTSLGNSSFGVGITGGTGNTIGGTTEAARNVIAGNFAHQVVLFMASDNTVQGNYVGTDKNGDLVSNPADTNGILIGNGSTNNLVGGTSSGSGNKIAHNTAVGVLVMNIAGFGTDPLNNSIIGNDIQQNTSSGIRLCNDTNSDFACDTPEPYPNDDGDPDEGPNMFMNFPVINSATKGTDEVTVNYNLDINDSEVGATGYSVDFYANSNDAREGAIYLGYDLVAGDVAGQSKTLTLPGSVPDDYYVTAVATMTDASADGFGHSSEFSAAAAAVSNGGATGGGGAGSDSSSSSGDLADTGENVQWLVLVAVGMLVSGFVGDAVVMRKNKA